MNTPSPSCLVYFSGLLQKPAALVMDDELRHESVARAALHGGFTYE